MVTFLQAAVRSGLALTKPSGIEFHDQTPARSPALIAVGRLNWALFCELPVAITARPKVVLL